jgi:putative nucleotidyltransferase with HDIG domain
MKPFMNNLAQAAHLVSESSHGHSVPGQRHPARVLIVDDERAACRLLSLILGPPAFQCASASCGEDALAILRNEHFDAIISDLRMPGIGGLELLADVRRTRPYLAFLVTTGIDDVDVGVEAMRAGADDYLVKPLSENVVTASLERALHKRHLERQVDDYRHHLEEMVEERTGQLQEALRQIESGYGNTLEALGRAIDLRDRETSGHSRRVCRYSLEIARAMDFSEREIRNLERGAYLHDIGKLGIPDGILLKPGPLTAEEWVIMRSHVEIGFNLIQGIPFLAEAAEVILTHHERYDGSGYPRGLKGQQIAPGGQIFAVADSFDAITSDRPYRKASSFEAGRDAIRSAAGQLFAPEIVAVFLNLPLADVVKQ